MNARSTKTEAFGATQRSTPAPNVPWPAYGARTLSPPPSVVYGSSWSPRTPESQACLAAAPGISPVSTMLTDTPYPSFPPQEARPPPPPSKPGGGTGAALPGTSIGSVAGHIFGHT